MKEDEIYAVKSTSEDYLNVTNRTIELKTKIEEMDTSIKEAFATVTKYCLTEAEILNGAYAAADTYQQDVLKYAPDYYDRSINVSYAAMGLCGEAGEASELVKKFVYHDHPIDSEHLALELGDVLWYVSYMAHLFGYSLSEIMDMNREKLAKRYPDGKFDVERSRNRREDDI